MDEKPRKGKLFRKNNDRKIFNDVFDAHAEKILHQLASKGWFKEIEHIISTGKEAHVFKAIDASGNAKAIKIYKIETSDFKHMFQYIDGDKRFKNVRRIKRDVVYVWTRKEFKNLEKAMRSGILSPVPLAFKDNILVMSFIGGEEAAPTLREIKLEGDELASAKEQIIDGIARLFYNEKLVHADLSEYNMLYFDSKVHFIDIGQGVLTSHPNAKDFFERDLRNVAKYLTKEGIKTSEDELREKIKQKKTQYI